MRRGELPILGRGEVGEAVNCVPKEESVVTDQVVMALGGVSFSWDLKLAASSKLI